jgi:hypothetical protein
MRMYECKLYAMHKLFGKLLVTYKLNKPDFYCRFFSEPHQDHSNRIRTALNLPYAVYGVYSVFLRVRVGYD